MRIRALEASDHAAWLPLWLDYLRFYQTELEAAVTQTTWSRLIDPAEPMIAYGAFEDEALLGIAQILFHRATWNTNDYCYLSDLFTVPSARGRGIGRALIEHVCAKAKAQGAPRVYWHMQASNEVARRLYERVGDNSGFLLYRKAT